MQGQRGTIGSLPEALNFDHGSASNSAAIDPQICWSGIHNPGENRFPNYILSPNDANMTFANPIYREQQDLNRWSCGESSSSGTKNEVCHDEHKSEHGWSSSAGACAGAVPRSEGRRNDSVSVNPLFAECSNSNIMVQNLNLNTGFVGNDESNQNMEHANVQKSSRSENEQVSSATGSEYVVEDNGGRPGCTLEGRRTSCKRKALEGSVGQSSSSGSCNDFQGAEGSAWTALPPCYSAGSGLSISSSSEQVNQRLVLGSRGMASGIIPDSTVIGPVEGSHRNFRLRINPSNQQEPINPTLFSAGIVRHSSTSTLQQSSSLLPVDHSLDLRSAPAVDNMNCQSQSTSIHVPALPRNVHPFRWSGGSTSRTGSSASSSISVDRDAMPREETRSRNLARSMVDNHLFMPVPEFRSSVRNPTNRSLTGLNISIPGNIASTSRVGSSSGGQPSSNPAWVPPPPNPPAHFPRRFSELVRRSLLSTIGADSGGTSNDRTPLRSVPPASHEETVLPSGSGSQGHRHSYPRSAPWLERQGDSVLGIPHSLRALAAGNEGRSRLVVSEIRNVLDLMRRGESLRFEDVMILDQSMFFGVADIHDRHRDMRLDVDNMSYEELLALEERIGNVSTGLNEETIKKQLKLKKCSIAQGAQQEGEPCCICQEEYKDGEDLGGLECGHDFHTDCIKQWLMRKNLCPICKTAGLTTK